MLPEIPRRRCAEKDNSHIVRELMFHHRSTEFDPRVSAIAGHLRAIEKELGGIGRSASRNASERVCREQSDRRGYLAYPERVVDRFGRGQRAAVDEAASSGKEAVKISARAGNDALGRIELRPKPARLPHSRSLSWEF